MKNFDISVITLFLSSATALAAVIGPIISSVINVRSNERTKRFEQYAPQLYAAVNRFSNAYSDYPRADDPAIANGRRSNITELAVFKLRELSAAAYDLISFIPDQRIHAQVIALLDSLRASQLASPSQDAMFQKLSALLAEELASQLSDKRKAKRSRRKGNGGK